jgi:hypothetical protein
MASTPALKQTSEDPVFAAYRNLDKNDFEIRLVLLEPAAERSTLVVCRLEIVKVRENPKYEALSWCWGDPNDEEEIFLEGHKWLVRKNLATSLRYLRYENRARIMWIDALSIYQKNSSERDHQIQLMKYVYSMAQHVVVWMGVPSDDLACYVEKYLTGQSTLIQGLVDEPEKTLIFGTVEIRQFPWWQRMWILQEIALASNISVHFGSVHLPFDRLIAELATLHQAIQGFSERHSEDILWQMMRLSASSTYIPSPYTFYDLRRGCSNQAVKYRVGPPSGKVLNSTDINDSATLAFQDFARHVVRFRHHATSNPRDKLYGLLGLVPDIVGHILDPRYEEGTIRIYRRTAIHIIRSSKNLYILSQAQINLSAAPHASMLPSWVPDWAATLPVTYDWERALFREYREKFFDASSGVLCEVRAHDDDRVLVLQGVMIDTISSCRSAMPSTDDFQQWWQQTKECRDLAQVYDFRESADDLYIDGGPLNRAYWRTFLYNTLSFTGKRDNSEREYSLTYDNSNAHLEDGVGRPYLEPIDDPFLNTCSRVAQAAEEGTLASFDTNTIFAHLLRVNTGKNFFVTPYGFIGTGTDKIQTGDQVWVLAGGSHAFILREDISTPRHHVLVGEAYVDGLMMSGDLKKPYVSRCVSRRRGMGDKEAHTNGDELWEEVSIR